MLQNAENIAFEMPFENIANSVTQGSNFIAAMDDLRFRKIFNLGITKDIFGKKLSKLEKLQSLVAKCCKIRKI
jgi:hypothetical protein